LLHHSYSDCVGVRESLRNDCTLRDAIKAAVAARENEINNVDLVQNQAWFHRPARDAFKLMIDGKRLLMDTDSEDDSCICGMVDDKGGRCMWR
jgi:hypothetical protein